MKNILIAALCCAAFLAHAQVYKCQGPGGKTIYSDTPCAGAGQVLDQARLRSNSLPTPPPKQLQKTVPEHAQPAPFVFGGERPGVPSELDIKNMETSASSIHLTKREKLVRQAQINAAKDLRAGGSGKIDMTAVEAEDERVAARRAAAQQSSQSGRPVSMANCDPAGCWDTSGTRYNRAAGDTFFRQDGRACQRVGDQLQCN
jgi:hypothetical protein